MLTPLTAISPVDGRYRNKTEKLADYFSEQALIRYRIRVEVEYFIALCELPLPQLAGVDKAAISRRAKKEAWAQDVTGAVDRAVDAKVNGIVNTVDPEKKAAAIASAADEKVAVIIRHREEWETQRELVTTAIEKNDFDKAKLAKITAETLKIRQEAERKAWGIRDVDAQPDGGALTVRILRVSGE